jgi:hypothetical protein
MQDLPDQSAEPKLTVPQTRALEALLQGQTFAQAAVAASVSERSVYRWSLEPAFKRERQRAEFEALSNARGKAVRAAPAAVSVLLKVMTDPAINAAIRANAAKDVLRFATEGVTVAHLRDEMDRLEERQDQLNRLDPCSVANHGSI